MNPTLVLRPICFACASYSVGPGHGLVSNPASHSHKLFDYNNLWRGDQLAEVTPAYEESIHWLYEPGALTPVARSEKGRLHYVVTDHMGTPRELLTEKGDIAWASRLSTWGKATRYRLSANDDSLSCHLRFAGQYADEESGLHYNRHRYYDSETGQYLSPDPIGLAGGVNPYGYVHNPLSDIDPLGLSNELVTYWPPNDGASGAVKVSVLEKGTLIDRYGYPGGKCTSPVGTPYSMRALPLGTETKPYTVYEVMKPIPRVYESKISPWFGEKGLGTQYYLPESVKSLVDSEHLREVEKRCKCG